MHYTHLSNASGKFVAPIMTTPSLGLKLYEKKAKNVFLYRTNYRVLESGHRSF